MKKQERVQTGYVIGQASENITFLDYIAVDKKTGLIRKAIQTDIKKP